MTYHLSLQLLLLIGFCGLCAAAMVTDLRKYLIPNRLSYAVAGLFFVYAFSGFADWRTGLLAGFLVFAAGVFLFARGLMGGGDVKLLTAVAMWAGTDLVLPMLLVVTLTGGVMSGAEWVRLGGFNRFLARFIPAMEGGPGLTNVGERAVVPYAAAIFAGAAYVAVSRVFVLI